MPQTPGQTFLSLIKHHAMQGHWGRGGVWGFFSTFLITARDGVNCKLHTPAALLKTRERAPESSNY